MEMNADVKLNPEKKNQARRNYFINIKGTLLEKIVQGIFWKRSKQHVRG